MHKESKKNKSNKLIKVTSGLLIIILILEVIFLLKINKSNNHVSDDRLINAIETPVVDLVYGFEAVDRLKVSVSEKQPYDVTFLADINDVQDVEILKFYFDEGEKGTPIGTITDDEGKEVKISYQQYDFKESSELNEEAKIRLYHVQEELLDKIISNLNIIEYASEEEIIKAESILIETPFVKIPYPRQWEKYLVIDQIEGEPHKVVFSCQFEGSEPVELFSYMFGEGAENVIGSFDGTPVGLTMGNGESDEKWEMEEMDIFYEMREESNYIIDYLVATGEFTLE